MSRAQSDAIGFVLVFSLIVLTVGTVYAAGYPALEEFRTGEQLENMERAFDVLDDNLDDLSREGAPSRATEIKLNGGTLAVNGSTTITVNATTPNPARGENFTVSDESTPITYSEGDTTVASAHGAVFRQDGDAAVMRSEPGWVIDDDHALIPLVVTDRTGDRVAFGGSSTVLIRGQVTGRGIAGKVAAGDDDDDVTVTVTVESPRADAWKRYFESEGFTAVDDDPDDGEVTYRFEVDSVVVQQTTVSVELEG
ncbi:DUF7289 family protein [Halobaculum magnesiiphilum]|uniref:Uncharacterized protein n=1 Tax=Halobaculum magnesiiphilum TaxID=1017351 RepID=A0A8T8WD58_9EURY|nr:hypothetical protein [Halobaculum magnesiiphilum]QZP37778.1 hypothetical protein K6T50_00935 [Halobaculum magnesiiphilum]